MIEARSLDEAHDVIGNLFEAGFRRRALLGLEFGELGLGIGGERRLSVRVARTSKPVAQGLGYKTRHECRHDEAAVGLEAAENVIRRIAWMITQRVGVGMRERYGRLRHVEHPAHRLMRRMSEVDHDAETVEFA